MGFFATESQPMIFTLTHPCRRDGTTTTNNNSTTSGSIGTTCTSIGSSSSSSSSNSSSSSSSGTSSSSSSASDAHERPLLHSRLRQLSDSQISVAPGRPEALKQKDSCEHKMQRLHLSHM